MQQQEANLSQWTSVSLTSEPALRGSCHCGALTYTTTSPTTFSGYCHCTKCQRLTGGPFVATFHFPLAAVAFRADPAAALHTYAPVSHPDETRYRCDVCGVGVGSANHRQGHAAVWGGTLARIPVAGEDSAGRLAGWERIRPVLHCYYGARMLDVRDGLRKYSGCAPEEAGAPGSWGVRGGDMDEREGSAGCGDLGGEQPGDVRGACFCGAVAYAFPASSVVRSAYCHCTQCQKLTGCPFIHTIHLPSPAVAFTLAPGPLSVRAADIRGDHLPGALRAYNAPAKAHKMRLRCAECGTFVASSNSRTGTTSVWGVHLTRSRSGHVADWDKVKPSAHIFYGTHVLAIDDGLGKWSGYEGSSERLDV